MAVVVEGAPPTVGGPRAAVGGGSAPLPDTAGVGGVGCDRGNSNYWW